MRAHGPLLFYDHTYLIAYNLHKVRHGVILWNRDFLGCCIGFHKRSQSFMSYFV